MAEANVLAPLTSILNELVDGPPPSAGFVLNPGDVGLLKSLDKLTAAEASAVPMGGSSSVASHADHLRFGLTLMNRWGGGEKDPFSTADWAESWRKTVVTEQEWDALRKSLRAETIRWRETLRNPPSVNEFELTGMVGSVVHLAYHLGAIRQIARVMRGPSAGS